MSASTNKPHGRPRTSSDNHLGYSISNHLDEHHGNPADHQGKVKKQLEMALNKTKKPRMLPNLLLIRMLLLDGILKYISF